MYAKLFYENFKDEYTYLLKEDNALPSMLASNEPNKMMIDTILKRVPDRILPMIERDNKEFIKKHNIEIKIKKLRETFKNADKSGYELLKCLEGEKYWIFLLSHFINKDIKIINNSFLFNDYYLYRYLNCIFNFENTNHDCFEIEKYYAISSNKDQIESLCSCVNYLIQQYNEKPDKKIFSFFFYFSLWANQYDLSINPTKYKKSEQEKCDIDINKHTLKEKKFYFGTDFDKLYDSFFIEKILCNDIDDIHLDITSQKRKRFDIVLDNMGLELVSDLCFLYFLTNYFDEIVIHVKKHPLLVSDVMAKDIHYCLNALNDDKKYPNTALMASKWKQLVETNKWKIKEDLYWNLPLPYWVMHNNLLDDLKKSCFVCFKGDVNYRRCIGDLKFNYSTPHKDVFSYLPFRTILLRCLKTPVGCGMNKNAVEKLNKEDDDWITHGEYAILQYYNPK